ncbi:MAG: CRISPR-associated protein Cas2 [Clostridia bacterium]|nr:CRISPR-associated protein Cas2 [Clostridia bacterium]
MVRKIEGELMFVILVYDVNQKRVARVLKTARKYLYWVQNSVLEGEISEANYVKLKTELSKKINKEEDSIIFYTFRTTRYSKREVMGMQKGGEENIL